MITVPEILLKGVELAGDRRKTRYSRLRTAVKNGLVDADEPKVQRQSKTDAVDPELSDVMRAQDDHEIAGLTQRYSYVADRGARVKILNRSRPAVAR